MKKDMVLRSKEWDGERITFFDAGFGRVELLIQGVWRRIGLSSWNSWLRFGLGA